MRLDGLCDGEAEYFVSSGAVNLIGSRTGKISTRTSSGKGSCRSASRSFSQFGFAVSHLAQCATMSSGATLVRTLVFSCSFTRLWEHSYGLRRRNLADRRRLPIHLKTRDPYGWNRT